MPFSSSRACTNRDPAGNRAVDQKNGSLPPFTRLSDCDPVRRCALKHGINLTAGTTVTATSPVVNVMAYGSTCNGTADDTAAIAAAVAAMSSAVTKPAGWGFSRDGDSIFGVCATEQNGAAENRPHNAAQS
jgi:hypothetical protein